MLPIDYYDVRINSTEHEIVSERIHDKTTFPFEYSNNHSSITFRVNITIVDVKGQRSNSTTFIEIFGKYVCTMYYYPTYVCYKVSVIMF